jgi:hypothetical protein
VRLNAGALGSMMVDQVEKQRTLSERPRTAAGNRVGFNAGALGSVMMDQVEKERPLSGQRSIIHPKWRIPGAEHISDSDIELFLFVTPYVMSTDSLTDG